MTGLLILTEYQTQNLLNVFAQFVQFLYCMLFPILHLTVLYITDEDCLIKLINRINITTTLINNYRLVSKVLTLH